MKYLLKHDNPPTKVIKTPCNYERTHELANCPLCYSPNLYLHMHLPVREFGYFDINLYTCDTVCECYFGSDVNPLDYKIIVKPHKHKFSIKHEFLKDAENLQVYDRTHSKGIW